jgi:beta-adrenergic-receptor kinase
MADLEAVLADVSYLMAMERSKAPAAKTIKKLTLPDSSIHNVVHLHFRQEGTYLFETIHSQRMGKLMLCSSCSSLAF